MISDLTFELEILRHDAATEKKEIGTRERDTLLKLVIGMAVAGYKYDPTVSRSKVTSEIADDLPNEGIPLDPGHCS